MHRSIVKPGQIPLDTDLLNTNRNTSIALSKVLEALIGTDTKVDGLACVPTSPASMQVEVGPGQILSLQNVDGAAYGALLADTTHQVVKQGLLMDKVTLSAPAPATGGNSINYLVQAAFQVTDGVPVTRPYYNSANPAVAWNGPANAGTPDNTLRQDLCVVTIKAGASAPTGTQTTPAADAGNVPLWVVTVANGATTIIAGNISQHGSAPFIAGKVGQAGRTRLAADKTFYVATTGSDANDGQSIGAPWLTLQHAWDTIQQSYDLNGFNVTVQVADGTYTSGVSCVGPLVGQGAGIAGYGIVGLVAKPSIVFQGNVGTPANVIVTAASSNCFLAANGAVIALRGMEFRTTGGAADAVTAFTGGAIGVGSVRFGSCTGNQFSANYGGLAYAFAAYTVSGGGNSHLLGAAGGNVITVGTAVTVTGTPAFVAAFAYANAGIIKSDSGSFSGAATGTRYNVVNNGNINTSGGGASFYPGNVTGTFATGGVYN